MQKPNGYFQNPKKPNGYFQNPEKAVIVTLLLRYRNCYCHAIVIATLRYCIVTERYAKETILLMTRKGKATEKGCREKQNFKKTLLKSEMDLQKSKTKGIITMRKLTPMRAIRKKCLDCCAYQPREVLLCPAVNCPLYSYRLGHKPSKDNNPIDESNTEKNAPTAAE